MPEYFRFVRVTFDPSKYDAMMAHADTQIAKMKAVAGIRAVRVVRVADRRRQNKLQTSGLASPSS